MALLKLALLGVACNNRSRLTPAVANSPVLANSVRAKRQTLRSIGFESGVGLLVVLAAGLLTSLPPVMHLPPVWPFARTLDLDAIRDDAAFRREVLQAAFALAGAAALIVAACFTRRLRWPAVALAAVIAGFALPHLDLLLAEAFPTSCYRSPTEFAASAIVEGARLYPEHCASCHGTEGHGDGPAPAGLRMLQGRPNPAGVPHGRSERDTPPVVQRYASAFIQQLVGLTGAPEAVRGVTDAYRLGDVVRHAGSDPAQYAVDHNSVIYLVGTDGRYIAPIRVDQSGQAMVAAIGRYIPSGWGCAVLAVDSCLSQLSLIGRCRIFDP